MVFEGFKTLPVFKSESEAKLLENERFSQFAICLLFREITFLNNKSFLIPVDEIDDWCIFEYGWHIFVSDASKIRVTVQTESEAKLI